MEFCCHRPGHWNRYHCIVFVDHFAFCDVNNIHWVYFTATNTVVREIYFIFVVCQSYLFEIMVVVGVGWFTMGYNRCIPKCTTGYKSNPKPKDVKLHPNVDTNKETRELWIKIVTKFRDDGWEVSKSSRVCSLHFRPEDFGKESVDKRSRTVGTSSLSTITACFWRVVSHAVESIAEIGNALHRCRFWLF